MDIARALGERVSGLLEERASMRPPASSDIPVDDADADGQGSKPQTTNFTQTFASREFRPAPSTRRLPEEDAAPSGEVASAPNTQISVPPTERSVASDERPSVSRRSVALGSAPSLEDDIGYETLATRPIETEAKPARGSQRPKAQPRGLLAGGALAAAALVGLWLYANRTPASPPDLRAPTTAATLAASMPPQTSSATSVPEPSALASTSVTGGSAQSTNAVPSGAPTVRSSPATSARGLVPSAVLALSASASGSSSAPAAPASGVATARAKVSLLCGAQTQAFVDGVARGGCPVRGLEVSRGVHEIRFIFEPTGESRGERVLLEGGESVTVRADFTGATPQVWVSRP
jgi:hypothetical protein